MSIIIETVMCDYRRENDTTSDRIILKVGNKIDLSLRQIDESDLRTRVTDDDRK